jgi:uroporphyrinogen-III synthase
VGDRTHACLKNILGISSFFPDVMTGKGVLQVLQKQNISKVLLVSGQDPRKEFVDGLSSAGINFFHFPVYKIHINENSKFSVHFNDDLSNYLIITSPSSVDGILKILSLQDLSELKTRIISIGPTTSEAILQNKGDVFFESEVQNINVLYDHLESIIIKSSVK